MLPIYCNLVQREAAKFDSPSSVVFELVEQLILKRIEDTIELFLLADNLLSNEAIKTSISQDYVRFKNLISQYPEALDTPEIDYFINTTRTILRISQESGYQEPEESIRKQFYVLNRILAGYCILKGIECVFCCQFDAGQITFPHAGILVHQLDSDCRAFELKLLDGQIHIDGKKIDPLEFTVLSVPGLHFFDRRIYINREEPAFEAWCASNPFNETGNPRLEDTKKLHVWVERMKSVRLLYERFWPEIGRCISAVVKDIVPIQPPESIGVSLSCSSAGYVGAIISSIVPPEELGEMVIHEYAHNLLNISMHFEQYFLPDGYRLERYYSPLRFDPRPISGVFHAFHSLVHMAMYYHRLGQDQRYAATKSKEFTDAVINARLCYLVVSSSGLLTNSGLKLAQAMNELTGELMCSKMWHLTSDIISEHENHLKKAQVIGIDMSWLNGLKLDEIFTVQAHAIQKGEVTSSSPFVEFLPASTAKTFSFLDDVDKKPVVFNNLRIFDEDFLTSSNILEKFGDEMVTILELDKHMGYGDTPKSQVTLREYLTFAASHTGAMQKYLGVQPINDWNGVVSAVRVWDILKRFFLDNNRLLFFRNNADTIVLMHQDSSNNLHFNLWGKKTFYLCPPNTEHIYAAHSGYREGFSPVNPFADEKNLSSQFPKFSSDKGTFVTLNAGDCLYIPKNWWHAVKYEDECASVTCWDRYYSDR